MAAGRGEGLRRMGLLAAVVAILSAYVWVAAAGDWWVLNGWVGYPVVGAVILASRPGNVIGRLMLAVGSAWAVSGLGFLSRFGGDGLAWLEVLGTAVAYVVWCALAALVAVFPSGTAETAVGRVVVRLLAVVAVTMAVLGLVDPGVLESGRTNPFGWDLAGPVAGILTSDASFVVVPALMGAALVDLLVRYRRSAPVARLQYRWFLFAVTFQVVVLILSTAVPIPGPTVAVSALFNLIPVAVGIAVTRYGLYEIDRVVSRTLAYALVTAAVVGTYAVVVTSLPRLLPASSTLAVAAATLAAAAVFRPVLRRVQAVVDRRFNRERYDAERIVDAFGARLRGETDPDAAAADLLSAVGRALQPGAVGLWVRDSRVGASR